MSTPDNDMVPRATLVAVAESFNALKALERQRAATQAEMIRTCLAAIRMDVNNYRVPSHLNMFDKQRIEQVKKNKQDQKKAFIYLEVLATMLEDQANAKPTEPPSSTERQEPIPE